MSHQSLSRRRWRAFTMIELLVVITIIAVLVAILMPALRMAKDQAYSAKCMNNMHQLALAMNMYGHDRGRYPWCYENYASTENDSNWAYQMTPYLTTGTNNNFGGANIAGVTGDNGRSPVIMCPAAGRKPTGSSIKLHYSMNYQLGGEQVVTTAHPRVYPYDVRAAEVILFADGTQAAQNNCLEMLDGHSQWDDAYNPVTAENVIAPWNDLDTSGSAVYGSMTFRHKQYEYGNACFIDGHIEQIKRGQLKEKHIKLNSPVFSW